jgi:cytochrome c-type biogenesis protein CcmH/NrfG
MNQRAWPQAIAEIRSAIAIDPAHPGGHAMLAQVLYVTNDLAGARGEIGTILEANPTDLQAHQLLAAIELRQGRWDAAAEVIATGRRVYPDRHDFRYLEALANMRGGLVGSEVQAVVDQARGTSVDAMQQVAGVAFLMGDRATIDRLQGTGQGHTR